ncbi:MAG: PAS domain S-box protein [Gemmatimonadales bacterium]
MLSWKRLSIERKLPLAITILLVAVIGGFTWASYQEIKSAALKAATDRLESSADQFGDMLGREVPQRLSQARRAARHPALRAYLERPQRGRRPGAVRVLDSLEASGALVAAVELWDRGARQVLAVGDPRPSHDSVAASALFAAAADSAVIGPFRILHDTLLYAVAASVPGDGGVIGYLVERRRVVSQAARRIAELIDPDARVLIGNRSGDAWSDFVTPVQPPQPDLPAEGGTLLYERAGIGGVLARAAPVPSTPWMVVVELQRSQILARARATLGRLALIALGIVALGAAGGWAASRRITAPLARLTDGAEAIAGGRPAPPVVTGGSDEIARLAEAFNTMTTHVEQARRGLEAKVAERTRALEEAQQRLERSSEERYRVLFHRNPLPMWVYHRETLQFLDVNEAALRHYGYSRDEFLQMTLKDIRPAEDVPGFLQSLPAAPDGLYEAGVWRHRKKDGTLMDVEVTRHHLEIGGRRLGLVLAHDVTARVAAEREAAAAQDRLSFLAEASTILAASLDFEETLRRVADLAVPRIADWCAVDFVGPDGRLARVALVHRDEGKLEVARQLRERYPPDLADPRGVAHVVRTGTAELYRDVPDALLAELARDPEHLHLLRSLGLRSAMIVPLRGRAGVVGTVTCVTAQSARTYGPTHLALAEELAGRAGTAIERARLYEQLARINAELEQRVEERTARLRASEGQFRAVSETANDAIISADVRGCITYFNPAAERIFGYFTADVVGRPVATLMPERFRDAHRAGLARYLATGAPRVVGRTVELVGRRKDGSEFPIELSLAAWHAGPEPSFTGIIRDISDRRHADELRAAHAAALDRANAELQVVNRELEAFSYSVSHDLRAPLRAIDGFSRILVEDHAGQLGAEARRLLDVVRRNTRQMGQLIDDLLAFSRLGRKEMQVASVEMGALVRAVADELLADGGGHDMDLDIGELPAARGDRSLLRQVWSNLLSNAFKYTRSRPRPRITVAGRVDGKTIVYNVTDNGVGFDMQYADKLFGVFQRLHRAEDFDGTGVGLAIVQRIVHRHGGRVWADGAPDHGATFYFTLPSEADDA